jgi:hypothetical protein
MRIRRAISTGVLRHLSSARLALARGLVVSVVRFALGR